MTFGATSSRSSAQFVKNRNVDDFKNRFPRAVESIIQSHYVDDLLDSVDTEEEVLGMWWYTERDTFTYRVSKNPKLMAILNLNYRPTKREVLRMVMTVFDPLGLIAHFLEYIKTLLQDMWRKQMQWDDKLDNDLFAKWLTWTRLLPQIETVEIPRCYITNSSNKRSQAVQVHVFVDAGEKAYAAAAYVRTRCNENVQVMLICAKSRVAPLKALSIPRLELEAAVLGTRLANSICEKHSIVFTSIHFWSDSQTVLGWLKSDHRRYRQFVAFRVSEILETTEMTQWQYVPTKENVADKGTKWAKVPIISSEDRWFKGPKFLYDSHERWPADKSIIDTVEELRSHHHHSYPISLKLENFSSWRGIRRGLAGAIRTLHAE